MPAVVPTFLAKNKEQIKILLQLGFIMDGSYEAASQFAEIGIYTPVLRPLLLSISLYISYLYLHINYRFVSFVNIISIIKISLLKILHHIINLILVVITTVRVKIKFFRKYRLNLNYKSEVYPFIKFLL